MATNNWTTANIADQKNRRIVITGANTGLGYETAKVLAAKNAHIIMAVRNTAKGETAKSAIIAEVPDASIDVLPLDLSSLNSVAGFCEKLNSDVDHIDVLVNNAGIMFTPAGETADGFELQMGTNHLGHFALTAGLLPLLKDTPKSRIVNLTSLAHHKGKINLDDLNWQQRKYKTTQAYYDSKQANMMFSHSLAEKLQAMGAQTISVAAHPGISATNLMQHTFITEKIVGPLVGQAADQGALPSLRAITDPSATNDSFYGPAKLFEFRGHPIEVKSSKAAQDAAARADLWRLSEQLTQLSF